MNLVRPIAVFFVLAVFGVHSAIDDNFVANSKAVLRVRNPTKRIEQLKVLSEYLTSIPKKPSVEHIVVDGDSAGPTEVHVDRFPEDSPLEASPEHAIVSNRRKRAFFDESNDVAPNSAASPKAEGFFEETPASSAASAASLLPSVSAISETPTEVSFSSMSSSAASSVHSRLRQVSLNPSRTDDIVPYDAHIDPDFPHEAPYARGLYNIPEGHNLDKDVDLDFRTGFRHGPPKSAVSSPQNADPHQLYIPSSFARYLVPSSNGIPQYQPMGYSYGAYVPTPYASYGSYPYQTYAQPSYGYPYSSPYEMG